MREIAILRAAHVQTPKHRQWEDTMLPALPCHIPLTLSVKHEEEEEEEEVTVEEGTEQQQLQQPSSHLLIISTPLKPTDITTEEDLDDTYVTPRRLPFNPSKNVSAQAAPSVLRSSLLKNAALAAACHQPSFSSSPPTSPPPNSLRPRSRSSSFATAATQTPL